MDPIHFLARVGPTQARHRRATPQEIDRFYQSDDWDAVWRVRAVVRRGGGSWGLEAPAGGARFDCPHHAG